MIDYYLPKNLYYQTLWFIRRYDEMIEEEENIIHATSHQEGPRGSGTGDPTARKAEQIEELHKDIAAVENALKMLPRDVRFDVLYFILRKKPYPSNGRISRRTYKRWQRKFVYNVAVNKSWI